MCICTFACVLPFSSYKQINQRYNQAGPERVSKLNTYTLFVLVLNKHRAASLWEDDLKTFSPYNSPSTCVEAHLLRVVALPSWGRVRIHHLKSPSVHHFSCFLCGQTVWIYSASCHVTTTFQHMKWVSYVRCWFIFVPRWTKIRKRVSSVPHHTLPGTPFVSFLIYLHFHQVKSFGSRISQSFSQNVSTFGLKCFNLCCLEWTQIHLWIHSLL